MEIRCEIINKSNDCSKGKQTISCKELGNISEKDTECGRPLCVTELRKGLTVIRGEAEETHFFGNGLEGRPSPRES